MQYKFPEEVINQALAYLGKQPYEEVHEIIANIKTSAVPVESATIQTEPDEKGKKRNKK